MLKNIKRKLNLKYRKIDLFPTYDVKHLKVGFQRGVNQEDQDKIIRQLGDCLDLIEVHFPMKYKDMHQDVQKLYITKNLKVNDGNYVNAVFINNIKSIEIPDNLFLSKIEYENRVEFIASLILHEAQHARLHRLGFGSSREYLGRIERVCYTIQRRFGEKITNGHEIVEYCDYALSVDLEKYYSTEAFLVRHLENLEGEEVPDWLKSYFIRKLMKKYKKEKSIKNNVDIHPDLEKWIHY